MASFKPKRRKVFRARTQVIRGKRIRIGLMTPGIKRARRSRGQKAGPVQTAQPSPVL